MKVSIAVPVLTLCLSVAVFAQHGGGHGNGGAGSMGGGSGMGAGAGSGSHGGGNAGSGSQGRTGNGGMGRQNADTALTKSPKLASNLEKMLPTGMTAQQACSGFKNLGQCVAAIHVSHNLNIPFADLKSKMTGDGAESLGKAIQGLKPDADAKGEEKKGKRQAEQDIDDASA